ncbi:hypothetical protein [Shewanella xiamenensis]|uniref:hypothetical protein n=1 Tax=Shewanella xiamenensis TaxID=332186 RepID=UPI0035B86035
MSESSTGAPEAGEGAMAIGITQWYVPLEDGCDHPFTPIFTSQTAVDKAIELIRAKALSTMGDDARCRDAVPSAAAIGKRYGAEP